MSKFPTLLDPKGLFNNLLFDIQHYNPATRQADLGPHLASFVNNTLITNILKGNKAPSPPSQVHTDNAEITKIQRSLKALTKAINNIQKKFTTLPTKTHTTNPNGKSPQKPQDRTYSAVAGTRPPNPSLIVDLVNLKPADGIHPWPGIICELLNKELGALSPPQIQLVATRWTAKGNLVVTGGPSTTPSSLQAAAPHISDILNKIFKPLPTKTIHTPWPNVKWSKISINSVPTGASNSSPPTTPGQCHKALLADNPSYAALTITQPPSWVQPPTSYHAGAVSSLSMAFEDPDGSKLKALLEERYLYAFGHRAVIKKWKYCPNKKEDKSANSSGMQPQAAVTPSATENDKDDEDVNIQLTPFSPATISTYPVGTPPPARLFNTPSSSTPLSQRTLHPHHTHPPRNAKHQCSHIFLLRACTSLCNIAQAKKA